MLFSIGQKVIHLKHPDELYMIMVSPEHCRIEKTNEPAYAYLNLNTGITWVRCQDEMEDGRFGLADEVHLNQHRVNIVLVESFMQAHAVHAKVTEQTKENTNDS